MCKTDEPLCTELYVARLINVIKSSMHGSGRTQTVRGRYSDAYVFILEGSCTYEFDFDRFTVKAGDILYLANNSTYKMTLGEGEYRFIYCDFEFERPEGASLRSFVCTPNNTAEAEKLFGRMLRISLSSTGERFNACMACLYGISGLIAESWDRGYYGVGVRQRLAETKLWIERNAFDSELTVSGAAEHCMMSEAYFRRNFKSIYRITPTKFITSVRIEKAKKLLSYPFITLSECASQCGFSSVQYFVRVFKETTGITPSRFRKL